MLRALALTGPTASGKTALSLALSEQLGCEIISLDSMQIYRGMDIGTAKATEEERRRIPHHMIDFLSPREDFSTECYREGALAAAREITARGKIPLFVGGTGLYLDTLMRAENTEVPGADPEWRARMLESVKNDGDALALWQRLYEIDPESAEKTHKNNVKRVLRALEIYEMTGRPKSYFDALSLTRAPETDVGVITLDFHSREALYSRIDLRVDEMMKGGLLAEVERLYSEGQLKPDTTAAQAIGYKEMLSYIKNEATLEEAVDAVKLASRRYAKRQLTWFRHVESAYHLFVDNEDGTLRAQSEIVREAHAIFSKMLNQK